MSAAQYHQDDLVWAKIRGCSWWPGVVSHTEKPRNGSEPQVVVNFIGENSHAVVPMDRVIHYREGYKKFSVTKKRSLLDAIAIADQIQAGTTTYRGKFFTVSLTHLHSRKGKN